MNPLNVPFSLPTELYGWLLLIGFIGVAYFVVRRTDIQSLRNANDDLRSEIGDKQRQIDELLTQLNGFKQQLAKLTGIVEEKDKRIDALSKVQVVQQSNPEVIAYMTDMRNFANNVNNYMVDTSKLLVQIDQRTRIKK